MQNLEITWNGERVNVTPDFDLFMKIEEKVPFNRIADTLSKARLNGNANDVPLSHLSWVVYCCLTHAGHKVRNPLDVQKALFDGSITDHGKLLGGLIVAYYGAEPEKGVKKKETQDLPRPSKKTSKNDSA